jgi:hypothetical protein
MSEPVEVIPLAGFDPDGEPEVRRMADGSLYVVFNFMPPSWAEDEPERFDDFDQQIARAAGVSVEWEDREFFRVARPAPDTVERVREFLRSYRR